MQNKPVRESSIETYLKEQIEACGGMAQKHKSTVNGSPDQLIAYNGLLYLVEVKRPGETLRESQIRMHQKFNECGVTIPVVDTKQDVDDFITNVLHAKPDPNFRKKPKDDIQIKTGQFRI